MAEITAKMVADLRAATGLGMMECKKALVEAEGNFEKAEEILRIKSGAKARTMLGRYRCRRRIGLRHQRQCRRIGRSKLRTDFVAKTQAS